MKSIICVVTASFVLLLSDCKLLVKEKNASTSSKADSLTRVTRAIFEDDTGETGGIFSKEYRLSAEILSALTEKQFHNKLPHAYLIPRYLLKNDRIKRGSSEVASKNVLEVAKSPEVASSQSVQVKKSQTKSHEMDYEHDLHGRHIKPLYKFVDSGEHEDEDFNLDDYDFDVNHDEFSGRGKPLEPRVKNKQLLEQQSLDETESTINPIKIVQYKEQQPTKVISKRHHIAEKTKKVADKIKEDDDYYTALFKKAPKRHNSAGASEETEFIQELNYKSATRNKT